MRIKLKYPDVDTFIQRYSVNISRGGIFIATRNPKPVGTVLRFEFQLATAAPIIRGEGQVIWIKPFDPEQPKKVHGMGVRFTRLDAESRNLIDRAMAWKREHEGEAPPERADDNGDEDEVASQTSLPEAPAAEAPAAEPPARPGGEEEEKIVVQRANAQEEAEVQREPSGKQAVQLTAAEQREAIAELWQSSQSQIVRAARHIAELTAAHNYYPEDATLAELLQPIRIPLPGSGREAARLLAELLG
jgi:uncharacterized protein (TIGR02266 family)